MKGTAVVRRLRLALLWVGVLVFSACGNNNSVVPYTGRSPKVAWTNLLGSFNLSPLTVVRLSNEKCDAGNGQSGTCLGRFECSRKGGNIFGVCGKGFGVCCVLTAKENGIAYGNNTRIYKALFDGGSHSTYTILRMSEDICQFRLDVVKLTMYEVSDSGVCTHDYMTVNQDKKFQKVCGLSEAIHYYIDVADPFVIFTFHTDAGETFDREWDIYVSQYTCDMGAPEGCGQWWWGTEGKIGIWNNVDPATTHWYYLDNQRYAICVRWEAGYCSITYTETLAFQPNCDDLFERPGNPTSFPEACIPFPPATSLSYTAYEGLQYFYVEFLDTTNKHVGSPSNPYKNPVIFFTQNKCT